MLHYTLNTGHVVHSSRSGVGDDAIAALRALPVRGGAIPHCAPYRVSVIRGVGSAVFKILRGQEPVVACGLAWTEAGESMTWRSLETLYLTLSDRHPQIMAPAMAPEKPDALPWLAVVLMPSVGNQRQDDVGWFGDFERCMAWAILDGTPA